MKNKALIYFVAIAMYLGSCITPMNKYTSSPHIDIEEPEIQGYPLMADLDISKEKVKGTATMGFSSGIGAPIEECKRSAIGNALISSDADVLIEPFYIIETTESSVTVMVSGFPAKYKNFRKDVEKMQAINAASVNQTTVLGPVQRPVSNVRKPDDFATVKQPESAGSVILKVFGVLGMAFLAVVLVAVSSE